MSDVPYTLPRSWRAARLGDIANVVRGVTYKKDDASRDAGDGLVPLLRSGNIQDRLTFTDAVYVPRGLVTDAQMLRPGDIVVSTSNSRELVGKAARLDREWSGTFGAFCTVVRPDPERIDAHYLGLFFQCPWYRAEVAAWAAATNNIANIRVSRLQELAVPLPAVDEQRRIAAFVESQLMNVERGAGFVSKALRSIDPYLSKTIQTILAGELPVLGPVVGKALREAVYRPLSEVATVQYGWTAKANPEAHGPRMLRITDIQDGRVDWEAVPRCEVPDDKRPKYKLFAGDIVFARIGATTGKSFLIGADVPEAVFASYLIRVRPDERVLSPDFLALFFQGAGYWAYIHEASRGIGRPAVNGKLLGQLHVPVPPLEAQEAAVREAHRHLDSGSALSTVLQQQLAQADELRQAVLASGLVQTMPNNDDVVLVAE